MIVDLLIKCYLLSSAKLDDARQSSIAIAQLILSGIPKGDEFNIICECSPVVVKMMADGLGIKTVGLLRKRIQDDDIKSDELIEGFKKSEPEINRMYAKFRPSFWGVTYDEYARAMSMLINVEAL